MLRRFREAESGAVAIVIVLVTCFVVIPLGALAVDIGVQRVSRSDAQAVADTTALDMARLLAANGSSSVTNAAATAAAARSSGAVGNGATVKVYLGTLSSTFSSDQSLGCDGNPNNSYFTQTSTNPTAVLVTVTNTVSFAIHGGAGGVCRSSIATISALACFHIGSYAAAVRAGSSTVLGPLLSPLGSSVDVNVLHYQGLATTQLQLPGLASALGVGSVSGLLATNTTVGGFLTATASALTSQGDTADASVVTALGAALSASVRSTPVNVGQLLSITQGGGAALNGSVNAFDLLMGAAVIGDGTNFVSVPGLSVNLPGVTSATVQLAVIQPPQSACGTANSPSAVANTSQVKLNVTASVLTALPSVLGLGVSAGPISVSIHAAQATGQLTSTSCATPKSMKVLATTSLLPATITIPITVSAGILGSMNLTAVLTTNPTNPTASTVTLTLPTNQTTPVSTGSGNLNLTSAAVNISPNGSTGLLGLVGITLSSLTNALISGPIATIESSLLTPLLSTLSAALEPALGLTLAGADLWADTLNCTNPSLAG